MTNSEERTYKPCGSTQEPETTIISWGLILRVRLESVPDIKALLLERDDLRIVYQCLSGNRLRVVPEGE